MLEAEDKLNF
uniref:Utrophin-like protein n=1 Tax=Triatoma infestans TaxID=30076 RepID=A0A170U449_TRIIF